MRVLSFLILLIFSSQLIASAGGMCCMKKTPSVKEVSSEHECPHHQSDSKEDEDHENQPGKHNNKCTKLCCVNIVENVSLIHPSYKLSYSWQLEFTDIKISPRKVIDLLFRPPIS